MKEQKDKMKIIIIVLAVLLAVSVTGLAAVLLYNRFAPNEPAYVEVPGNIITPDGEDSSGADTASFPTNEAHGSEAGSESAPSASSGKPENIPASSGAASAPDASESAGTASVSGTNASAVFLSSIHHEDITPFHITNMFPGDSETKYFRVTVYHKGNVIVRYHADIRPGYEKLSEGLQLRIRFFDFEGHLLYDGPIHDMPESLEIPLYTDKRTQSELYYEITAHLDTSIGNEFENLPLIADIRWWVNEVDNLYSPQTGYITNVRLWAYVAAGSLFILLILLAVRRKEAADDGVE